MAAYVLVGGAWLGGWCWQTVARRLRDDEHDVYPVTLTGLGERAHLAAPDVDLETHVQDIVNLIEFEDLSEVVLVGHSYAGMLVPLVADRLPERILRLMFVDTGPMPDGTALIHTFPPEVREAIEQRVKEEGDGWRWPMPPLEELGAMTSLEGLDEAQLEILRAKAVAQPFDTYTQPARFANPAQEPPPKVGILCSFSKEQVQSMIDSGEPMFAGLAGPEWQFVELPTGHWPMFSRPDDLAALLLDPASEEAAQGSAG